MGDMAVVNLAGINTARNSTLADAKANFDSVAAALYGCGETNPVPLPLGPNGTPIVQATVPASLDVGIGAVPMPVYGLANKRASNYNQLTLRSTTSSSACTASGKTCKSVAVLNVLISDALNAGPTTANINQIRDAVLALFTQASQRYIAKLTLSAHLPGDGMGGSTNPASTVAVPATNPATGSYVPAVAGKQATACGGETSYIKPTPCTTANHGGVCTANAVGASAGSAAGSGVSATGSTTSNTPTFATVMPAVTYVNPTAQDAAGIAATQAAANTAGPFTLTCTGAGVDGRVAGTGAGGLTNAAAGTCGIASGAGALAGNSCQFSPTNPATATNNAAGFALLGLGCSGVTNQQIQRAVRGLSSDPVTGAGVPPSSTQIPIACIDKSVCFNDVRVNAGTDAATRAASRCVRLCDPSGAPAIPGTAVSTYADRKAAYLAQVTVIANTNQPDGVGVGTLAGATGAGYWDPITAAQASLGGFCCAAEYYSTDGVGRAAATYGTITNTAAVSATTGPGGLGQSGFVLNSQFTPVQFTGSSMATETSPGVMCPVSGGTAGVSEFENPEQVYQLEGQAFYACMAGMQRSIATPTGTSKAIQDVNVAKQKKCSETITKMMKMNIGVPASTPTTGKGAGGATCAVLNALSQFQTTTAQFCRGTSASAIEYPMWSVGIGGTGTTATKYNVPNGYCYANACFEDLMTVGTESSFGKAKLGALVSSPDMGSNPSTLTTSCGRANNACAPAPTGWNGQVEFEKCAKSFKADGTTSCDAADAAKQVGRIPI